MEQLHDRTLRQHVREGMELAEGVVAGRGQEGKFPLWSCIDQWSEWNTTRAGDKQLFWKLRQSTIRFKQWRWLNTLLKLNPR